MLAVVLHAAAAAAFFVGPVAHAPAPPRSLQRAHVVASTGGLTLERAPPAPPPSAGDDDGYGGGSGDESEFLRLLNAEEQVEVLQDWASRSRIYKMTDNAEIAKAHSDFLDGVDELSSFDTSQCGESGRRMMLGLFDVSNLWAIATAEVSKRNGLVVSNICVYPSELNDPDSTAALRMVHALRVLADCIDTPIDLDENIEGQYIFEPTKDAGSDEL